MKVSIIMYHYVRDLLHSRYPNIKGLDIIFFKEQLLYLKKHYNFITMEMLIDSINNKIALPKKAVLLTFDDAYSDHYNYVFPILNKYKIQGSFFPPVKAITENTVLDVNKIHFILATEEDKLKIITEIKIELSKLSQDYKLESFLFYYDKLAVPNNFDSAEIIFIKRLLQVELDENIRKIITNNLFEKIVGINENTFSRELYMNVEQISCMNRNGMHIGGHSFDHYWLGTLNREKQESEIIKTKCFLEEIGCDMNMWTMCYPYGSYNEITIELLKKYNCKLGLTTEVDIANISTNNKYALPRLDTNNIPKFSNEKTNQWFINA